MKRKSLILFSLLILTLSACKNEDAELLRAENDDLREQISALEKENADLRMELDQLQAEMNEPGKSDRENNPIDRFYGAVETDGSTASMNMMAGSWAEAWEAETRDLAKQIEAQLPLAEDRDLVEAYLAAAEEQIERMDIMAIYQISDLEVPQEERLASAGTLRGVLWAGGRAEIWRDTFYQLCRVFPTDEDIFIFDPEAARLELMG